MSEAVTAAERDRELREETSMTHWWPRVADLDVPTPQTVRVGVEAVSIDDGAPATDGTMSVEFPDKADLADAIETVGGPPAFVRSDQMSEKHRMDQGSKFTSADPEAFGSNAWTLLERHLMAMGVPRPQCYYVREWLDLNHAFTAFGGTAIASELRWFINDGEIHDVDFYWPADAIQRPDSETWREDLAALREHALNAVEVVEPYVQTVAEEFDSGYWSVDFAETADNDWYLIDMARGEVSWHPDGVEKAQRVNDE